MSLNSFKTKKATVERELEQFKYLLTEESKNRQLVSVSHLSRCGEVGQGKQGCQMKKH